MFQSRQSQNAHTETAIIQTGEYFSIIGLRSRGLNAATRKVENDGNHVV